MMEKRGKSLRRPRGVARHISAAGCQFVLEDGEVAQGQRIAFALEGVGTIRGSVRWTVANRVGFAFEAMLDRDTQGALLRHGSTSGRIDFEFVN